jgi:hypothetical protein
VQEISNTTLLCAHTRPFYRSQQPFLQRRCPSQSPQKGGNVFTHNALECLRTTVRAPSRHIAHDTRLLGGFVLQVDTFTAERYSPHQITRQSKVRAPAPWGTSSSVKGISQGYQPYRPKKFFCFCFCLAVHSVLLVGTHVNRFSLSGCRPSCPGHSTQRQRQQQEQQQQQPLRHVFNSSRPPADEKICPVLAA